MFSELEVIAPAGLKTREFVLRPLLASDAELDYEAVMESREFLRKWGQSTWPEDDFTIEANRDDLMTAERRHANGDAFTYTVMNLDHTECLWCVYVLPPDAQMFTGAHVAAIGADQWTDCDATVFFWIRKSRLPEGLDRTLLDSLVTWFEREWSFKAPVVVTNEQFDQQVADDRRNRSTASTRGEGARRPGQVPGIRLAGAARTSAHRSSAEATPIAAVRRPIRRAPSALRRRSRPSCLSGQLTQ